MTLAERILKLVGQYGNGMMTDQDFIDRVVVIAAERRTFELALTELLEG